MNFVISYTLLILTFKGYIHTYVML